MDLILKRKREIEAKLNLQAKDEVAKPSKVQDKGQQFLNRVFGKRGVGKSSSSSTSQSFKSSSSADSSSVSSCSEKTDHSSFNKGSGLIFSNDGSFMDQFKKLTGSGKNMQETTSVKAELAFHSSDPMTEAIRKFAERVAREGDRLEDETRSTISVNSDLSFLHDPTSQLYLKYRRLVTEIRTIKAEPPPVIKREFGSSGSGLSGPSFVKAGHSAGPSFVNMESGAGPSFIKAEPGVEMKHEQGLEQPAQKKSRWGPQADQKAVLPPPGVVSISSLTVGGVSTVEPAPVNKPLLSQVKYNDPEVVQYAIRVFGTTDLSDAQWKQCTDQLKMQYLYQELQKKKVEKERLERAGKVKYEYDSDEETEGGTWEHKRRRAEMEKTKQLAEDLTQKGSGGHHIGDFLPPEELAKFTAKYNALKSGQKTDSSDYEEFKIAESNVGFKMLQKLGWNEGQGLGSSGSGITAPVNMNARSDSHGLGLEKPGELSADDDEFDVYRKRMMLAYRFRPNPLNNPRRAYY